MPGNQSLSIPFAGLNCIRGTVDDCDDVGLDVNFDWDEGRIVFSIGQHCADAGIDYVLRIWRVFACIIGKFIREIT